VRERVEAARQRQRERFASGGATLLAGASHISCNADKRPAEMRKFCVLDEAGKALMHSAMNQLQLAARAYHRVLKLARTMHSTMS
jgi:magnesium chelatase family protein